MIEQLRIHITEKGIFPIERKYFDGKILYGRDLKIYILKKSGEFLYVGKTNQTIGERFRGNFLTHKNSINKNNGANNYSYKWIKEFMNIKDGLDLFVCILETNDDNIAEAIEAELVYLVRKEKGYWPKFQHEIHFHNNEMAKEIANKIFKKVLKENN